MGNLKKKFRKKRKKEFLERVKTQKKGQILKIFTTNKPMNMDFFELKPPFFKEENEF